VYSAPTCKRHAALCTALVTRVEVWAHRFRPRLRAGTFTAKLTALRSETITRTIFASGPRTKGARQIASSLSALYVTATSAA